MRTFYCAGDLFDAKHLAGNAHLARRIEERSGGELRAVLPQDLEARADHPHLVRDTDLLALLDCDLVLFQFDGNELDSGTVAEFLFAKFADLPAVVLRTDFRSGGDQEAHPWNLMLSHYPRTEVVLLHALAEYKQGLAVSPPGAADSSPARGVEAADRLLRTTAEAVVEAFRRVREEPPRLPAASAGPVYDWLGHFPQFHPESGDVAGRVRAALDRKRSQGLLR